jgi:hypothetical protein
MEESIENVTDLLQLKQKKNVNSVSKHCIYCTIKIVGLLIKAAVQISNFVQSGCVICQSHFDQDANISGQGVIIRFHYLMHAVI